MGEGRRDQQGRCSGRPGRASGRVYEGSVGGMKVGQGRVVN